MASAAGCADADGGLCTVGEEVVHDQDVAGAVPAVLTAGLDAAVAVLDGVADEVDVLGTVRVDGKAGVIEAVAVGDGIAVDQRSAGVVDAGGGIAVVAGQADGDVAGVVEAVADDVDVGDVGGDGDGLGPAGLAVLDGIAEEEHVGNGAAAAAHQEDGVGAVILALGAGRRDVVDIEVTHDDMVGAGLQQDGAGITAVGVPDGEAGQLDIAAAVEPEHGGAALVLVVAVETGSVKNDILAGRRRDGDPGVGPALHAAVEADLAVVDAAPQIEGISGPQAVDDALDVVGGACVIDLACGGGLRHTGLNDPAGVGLEVLVAPQLVFVLPGGIVR